MLFSALYMCKDSGLNIIHSILEISLMLMACFMATAINNLFSNQFCTCTPAFIVFEGMRSGESSPFLLSKAKLIRSPTNIRP